MKVFDYERAWHQLFHPAFQALPANLRDLYERVCREAAALAQTPSLAMPWPEHSDLRTTFAEIPYEWLAKASYVVYFYGHWAPAPTRERVENAEGELVTRTTRFVADSSGGYWKFAHYCDQTLRAKLHQHEPELCDRTLFGYDKPPPKYGRWFEVHEGMLRYCFSTRNEWRWTVLGPATPRVLRGAIRETDLHSRGGFARPEDVEHLFAEGRILELLQAGTTYTKDRTQ